MHRLLLSSGATLLAITLAGHAAIAQETNGETAPAAEQGTPSAGTMGQGMGSGMMGEGMKPGMMREDMMGGGMHRGGMPPGMMLVLFTLLDTDGSETLSLEEVMAPHERMFQRVDEDDDGEVSLEEMRNFMQRMHGG